MHMKETYDINVVKLERVAFAKIPYQKRQVNGFKVRNLAYRPVHALEYIIGNQGNMTGNSKQNKLYMTLLIDFCLRKPTN